MKKILAIIGMLFYISSTCFANEIVITIPEIDITINDRTIENKEEKYPFITYKDMVYAPLTYNMNLALGISLYVVESDGVILNDRAFVFPYNTYMNDSVYKGSDYARIMDLPFQINESMIDLKFSKYPVLNYKSIIYLPLGNDYILDQFNIKYIFETEENLIINSDFPLHYTSISFEFIEDDYFDLDKLRDTLFFRSEIPKYNSERYVILDHNKINGADLSKTGEVFMDIVVEGYDIENNLVYRFRNSFGERYDRYDLSYVGWYEKYDEVHSYKIIANLYTEEVYKLMIKEYTDKIEVEFVDEYLYEQISDSKVKYFTSVHLTEYNMERLGKELFIRPLIEGKPISIYEDDNYHLDPLKYILFDGIKKDYSGLMSIEECDGIKMDTYYKSFRKNGVNVMDFGREDVIVLFDKHYKPFKIIIKKFDRR